MSETKDENWRLLYQELMKERRLYTDKLWETVKFFTTIYTAILSITILLVINLYDKKLSIVQVIPIAFFPVVSIIITFFGLQNLKREQSRFYETVATLKKVEKSLDFFKPINDSDRIFKEDKYVLPNKFVEIGDSVKLRDTDYFIDYMFKQQKKKTKYGKFYKTFKRLFITYIIIAVVIGVIVFLILPQRPC